MKQLMTLAVKSMRYRKTVLLLSALSVALSVLLLLGVERIRSNIHESFSSTISGTDLIVGARSGNIPLLLSTIFHIGYQDQNVSWKTYEYVASHPRVAWTIPLSLGDSHKGFPVVATNADFFENFRYGRDQAIEGIDNAPSVEGKYCVIGSKVAKELGYQSGDKLVVTHGAGSEEFVKHEEEPFTVSATLRSTGTPVDRSILVSLYELDEIHAGFYSGDSHDHDVFASLGTFEEHGHQHVPESITAFLIGLNDRSDLLSMQRMLNTYKGESLTAIMPVVTLLELWEMVRPVEKALMIISALVLLVSLGGILTTIMTSLNERRREMVILRSVGAKPADIFGLIMLETAGVMLVGILAGVLIVQVSAFLFKPLIAARLGLVIEVGWLSSTEILILAVILFSGLLIGLLPAYRTYKTSMVDGLTLYH